MKQTIETAYSPETLHRLQQTELDILKLFDQICKENNFQYFALYGTLLGAVRHKGIIPWDDDIDIGIMRNDYDRFCRLMEEHTPEGYEFINGAKEPRYPFMTARLMKKGTEFRMLSMKNCKFNLGIFLDIFPIDVIPDDPKKRKKMLRECWFWEKLTVLRNTPFPNVPYTGLKRYLVYGACAVSSFVLKVFPRRFLHEKATKARTRYQNTVSNHIGYPFGLVMGRNVWPTKKVFPLQELPYEDFTVKAPKDPDYFLTKSFGKDYMTPLPEGKRSFIIPYKLSFGDEKVETNNE